MARKPCRRVDGSFLVEEVMFCKRPGEYVSYGLLARENQEVRHDVLFIPVDKPRAVVSLRMVAVVKRVARCSRGCKLSHRGPRHGQVCKDLINLHIIKVIGNLVTRSCIDTVTGRRKPTQTM